MRIIALITALFFGFALPTYAAQGESCGKEAKEKGLKGDQKKAFMKDCKAARKAEHDKKEKSKDKKHDGKDKSKEGMEKGDKAATPATPAAPADTKK